MIAGIKSLFVTPRLFIAIVVVVAAFVVAYIFPLFYPISLTFFFLLLAISFFEILSLYRTKEGIVGHRSALERLSNGDQNDLEIYIDNRYPFKVDLEVIDEIPEQFQYRDKKWHTSIEANSQDIIHYRLRPVKRGEYNFGAVNVYASAFLGLWQRRFRFSEDVIVPVYPSYIQMNKYEFAAFTHQLKEFGIKKVRRLGHTMEFEQIKEYVRGDDPRTINWRASARSNNLMVNHYQDEKSQPVYCLIDKGRLMRFPFDGLSLLDYAINAALVLSNIALKKQDKAGIITFSNKLSSVVSAEKKGGQLKKIMESLYNQKTLYKEANFELLSSYINTRITHRSLLLCFTNFESLSSFKRQLPYFVSLAKRHLVVIVFFKNKELDQLVYKEPEDQQAIYTQVIAQKYETDKHLIVKQLLTYGIHSILTYPEDLSINTINKYLELKARGTI